MNSDTRIEVEEIAKRVGAIITCPECSHYDIFADDHKADRKVYAEAIIRAKDGNTPGFSGVALPKAILIVKGVLDNAPRQCPGCGNSAG